MQEDSIVEYGEIERYPGYRFGSDGSVWSCRVLIGLGTGKGTKAVIDKSRWRKLKYHRLRDGYPSVTLRVNAISVTRNVHRLVAEAFLGTCPDGMQVAHLNGIRSDPRLCNLSYKTPRDNQLDRLAHGTGDHGEKNHNAKLTSATVEEIRLLKSSGRSAACISKQYGITQAHVRKISSRKAWAHVP